MYAVNLSDLLKANQIVFIAVMNFTSKNNHETCESNQTGIIMDCTPSTFERIVKHSRQYHNPNQLRFYRKVNEQWELY